MDNSFEINMTTSLLYTMFSKNNSAILKVVIKMSKIAKTKAISIMIALLFIFTAMTVPASAETRKVIIGGEPFGLKLHCKGVMITGFENSETNPAKNGGLEINDIIIKADSKEIKTIEQMEKIIKKSNGKPIKIEILRNNERKKLNIQPIKNNDNNYYIGAWIKDSCAGIGTISFYSADSKMYAALGHGICDSDTGGLIKNSYGEILNANITSVTKSETNKIGMLNGYFTGQSIGTISSNTELGVYGSTSNLPDKKESFEIAAANEVTIGDAVLYTTVSSSGIQKYNVQIVKICNTYKDTNKNFVVKINDDSLIEKTGGIVQGMSGSPIVQNGKLAGVLTHVFLEDCKCGYGILAENMVVNC